MTAAWIVTSGLVEGTDSELWQRAACVISLDLKIAAECQSICVLWFALEYSYGTYDIYICKWYVYAYTYHLEMTYFYVFFICNLCVVDRHSSGFVE